MKCSPTLEGLTRCRRCNRIDAYIRQIKARKGLSPEDYWNRPVPGFGPVDAQVWLLGLAPGAHGANRTGRPFTGDGAGDFMYPLLHRAGFCSEPRAEIAADDGLELYDLYISNAVKCVPPDNKPLACEFAACRFWLLQEWHMLGAGKGSGALGARRFYQSAEFLQVRRLD